MKIRLLLCSLAALFIANSYAQTIVWSEDFGTPAAGTLANGFNNGNGAWTVTNTGTNGADPNLWYVSGEECGNAAGACGSVCSGGDASLHLGPPTVLGDAGAAYMAGGLSFFFPETDSRVESPTIDLTGQSNLTLNFNYLEDYVGQAGYDAGDDATLWYFDGVTWAQIDPLTVTAAGCAPQGTWTAFSIALPASANNNANVKIGFRWINDDDNVGTDPSFAVDDIEITTPAVAAPTADFSTTNTTICVGDCIDFTDASTLGTNPTWSWTFNGGTPGTSNVQNPTNICFNTAGTYTIELTVTDDNGTDTETKVDYITVTASANAGNDNTGNVCNDGTLDLNTLLIGADTGGSWSETSGTPSGQFTAGTGVLDGNGLTVGNVYTFEYAVGSGSCADVAVITITVVDCSVLTAAFTPSATSICRGDCITFADNSTGPITGWTWTLNGGTPASANTQDPGNVCFNVAGTYNIDLEITDGTNTNLATVQITVNDNPVVTATASSDTICAGDMVTLTGGGATSYVWDNGVTDGVSFAPGSTTTYTVTGTSNGCDGTAMVEVVVESCDTLTANFSYPANVCRGDCVTFTSTSSGTISSYFWTFGGGGTPDTSYSVQPTICFNNIGTYDVELRIYNSTGDSSVIIQQLNVVSSPSVNAVLDTVITLGGNADLIALASTPGSFLWTPDENIDCDTCSTTFASPWQDTDYIVTITDINGCTGTDTVMVLVNFVEAIGVPSAFSPNGDGENDVLYVKGIGISSVKFSVYNRYGQKVFETDNQGIGWDGMFKGREENAGVFAWMVEYTMVNGNSGMIKGNTTLVR